jgi:ABC-2 type transport system ATP-binding protein
VKALEVDSLRKTFRYGNKLVEAVRSVSLSLASGEVLAFLGANGAGKTTTIKMIAGLIRPDAGQVRIAGVDPHSNSQALQMLGAVLKGNRNLYWRLTPEENLEYFGVLKGLSCREARRRGRVLLERFGLLSKCHTTVQTLSRGMQQKLAIAVALIHQPQLLLLDEPTLGLDVDVMRSLTSLTRQLAMILSILPFVTS